ncbi:hypothetical protein [Clostridium rectalis]|uniref:hypothetical protein n=1 Tax=Clostridium rectalis TaxID=2040295 RepID=UPI000F636CE7|nr:hypothetical protein [Clostridium rectalis]
MKDKKSISLIDELENNNSLVVIQNNIKDIQNSIPQYNKNESKVKKLKSKNHYNYESKKNILDKKLENDNNLKNTSNGDINCKCKLIQEISNKYIIPTGINGPIIVKLPVLISEFEIEVNCESHVNLCKELFKIKNSKNTVYIKECTLIPNCNILFLSGYIRKSIDYLLCTNKHNKYLENKLKHFTTNVPYECSTNIKYFTNPIFNNNAIKEKLILSNNNNINGNTDYEYFNEPIYYNLVSSEIHELTLERETIRSQDAKNKITNSFNQKMILKLRIRLLQDQLVNIYSPNI